jgi:hypothetical protein
MQIALMEVLLFRDRLIILAGTADSCAQNFGADSLPLRAEEVHDRIPGRSERFWQ